jgi:hypothetical protein
MPFNMFAECTVDGCLIALILGMMLEPFHDIGVDAKRKLPFDGTIELSPLRRRPVARLWNIGRVNLVIRESCKGVDLRLLRWHEFRRLFLHGLWPSRPDNPANSFTGTEVHFWRGMDHDPGYVTLALCSIGKKPLRGDHVERFKFAAVRVRAPAPHKRADAWIILKRAWKNMAVKIRAP